jgi:hypothetical protein
MDKGLRSELAIAGGGEMNIIQLSPEVIWGVVFLIAAYFAGRNFTGWVHEKIKAKSRRG